MSTFYTTTIPDTDCIGDSLDTINNNFDNLGNAIVATVTATNSFNVVDSQSINLTFNNTTRTLSADIVSVTSLSSNGYQIMPGGLILQWGTVDSINFDETNQGPFYFPTSFPTACVNVVTTISNSTSISGVWAANVNTLATDSFYIFGDYDLTTGTAPVYWQAIGY